MKYTTLYVHDSTACWMQWRNKRLLQVFREPVTRELAERAASTSKKDGIQTLCPWLNARSPQVRLLIDPVADQTQLIPAFDYGFAEPHGVLERFRHFAEQVYLTFRSLTSDVLADDLARYRHDRLKKYPNALLQWHKMKPAQPNTKYGGAPRHWLVSDSGLSDYVFSWLSSMADNGLEFVDVRAVCALFAKQDAHLQNPVITIWVQSNRCRLIQCDSGFVTKVEQWNNTVEARIALQEAVSVLSDDGQEVVINYVGCEHELKVWQKGLPAIDIKSREDGVLDVASYSANLADMLPDGCLNLPVNTLIRKPSGMGIKFWSSTPHWETGSSIRILLSIARWKRRYKQTVIATTLAAIFSGYFVLLACMHAIDLIELHRRAESEIASLKARSSLVENELKNLSNQPSKAVQAIEKMNAYELISHTDELYFLKYLAAIINEHVNISIRSMSWRVMDFTASDVSLLTVLTEIDELRNQLASAVNVETNENNNERLLLITGHIESSSGIVLSHQQSSEELIAFLQALSVHEKVLEVMPLNDFMTDTPSVNLPSDAVVSDDEESGFVLAVRLIV